MPNQTIHWKIFNFITTVRNVRTRNDCVASHIRTRKSTNHSHIMKNALKKAPWRFFTNNRNNNSISSKWPKIFFFHLLSPIGYHRGFCHAEQGIIVSGLNGRNDAHRWLVVAMAIGIDLITLVFLQKMEGKYRHCVSIDIVKYGYFVSIGSYWMLRLI